MRTWLAEQPLKMGPNDGGIRRGGREETGDDQPRLTDRGNGDAHSPGDDSGARPGRLEEPSSSSAFDLEQE
ncbi:MAG: hypothetical protein JWP08_3717 [Bryobacterales bacterium]|nr:hypothetical protein [Bryobacterales bacterium]